MYCIKCGVKLADSERICPLCGTEVFHPDFPAGTGEPLYPVKRYPAPLENPKTAQIILTTLTTMALLITILCDLQLNGEMVWSGYVAGALIISYISLVLPFWFRKPNPVIFVPGSFAAVVALMKYVGRGGLYIFGGAGIALGALMPLLELLISITFESVSFVGWCWYPLIVLVLLGGMLIFLAIHNPARETMERKFFV